MIVLGIDPGIDRAGYALIKKEGSSFFLLSSGILSKNGGSHPQKLCEIRKTLVYLISKDKPESAVVESLFFSKNKKTALFVAEARGVILETLAEHSIPINELTPNQIKMGITGNGNASKNAVKKMVSLILKDDISKMLDDTTDAIAAGIIGHSFRKL